ncbi:MAG: GDP-L-fucose synthase [Rhodospirillales bacterium]|nr:GDP-L-fucose synthase [Rhodospirillales bacterium]
MTYALSGKRVWVAGHTGLVGSAIARRLRSESCEILTVSRGVLDLRRQNDVEDWVQENRPDAVFLAAAKVGGVIANMAQPEGFLYDNLMIESNVIKSCLKAGIEKILFLGSSCIYPRNAPQPIAEKSLLTGALESSNEGYALAKIAGLKLVESCRRQYGADFISAMPCNLYGPGDRYDATISHVIPAMIMKLRAAQKSRAPEVAFMGTGSALREFLYVDDLADGLVFLMQNFSEDGHINIGSGAEISIHDLAHTIARAVNYTGSIRFTGEGTDGTPRKVLDISRLAAMGWRAQTSLESGLSSAIDDYDRHYGEGKELIDVAS